MTDVVAEEAYAQLALTVHMETRNLAKYLTQIVADKTIEALNRSEDTVRAASRYRPWDAKVPECRERYRPGKVDMEEVTIVVAEVQL